MQYVNLTAPGWVKPGVTVLSVAAIATIGFAGTANASSRHPLPVPSASTYRVIANAVRTGQVPQFAPHADPFPGIPPIPGATGEQASPQFGAGKDVVMVEAMPGTFPAGVTPDLSQVALDFHQTVVGDPDIASVDGPCADNEDGSRTAPFSPCTNSNDGFQLDQPLSIVYDAADSTLPNGFVAPATVTDTISSSLPPLPGPSLSSSSRIAPRGLSGPFQSGCTAFNIGSGILFCMHTVTVQVPGAWRPVGLDLTNKVTGKALPNTKFTLSQGSTALGTATTDSTGHLKFPGVYQGGNFTVTQKTGVAGYGSLGAPLAVKVPAVTTAAQAGKEYDVPVKLAPLPPNAVDDTASTSRDKALVISVLHNDTTPSKPLTIMSVAKPQHGAAVANPDGTITYTPATGFAGTDAFTYTVRNALGGTDTATVKVTVIAPSVLGDRLAMTGQASWVEAQSGLGSLLVGGLLAFAGRRRRESR